MPTDLTTDLSLQYLLRKPDSTSKKGVILLHGVGSNENDLIRFADQLPKDFWIISPRGFFTISDGKFAWYQVDFTTGRPVINADQESLSRKVIRTFIQEVKDRYKLDEIYVGGFSQGAIMSYSVGLLQPTELRGIIALSGRVLDDIRLVAKKNAQLQQLRVFVAHGRQDNVLSIVYAKDAKGYLESLGVKLSYHEYDAGHQINNQVLQDLSNWLTASVTLSIDSATSPI